VGFRFLYYEKRLEVVLGSAGPLCTWPVVDNDNDGDVLDLVSDVVDCDLDDDGVDRGGDDSDHDQHDIYDVYDQHQDHDDDDFQHQDHYDDDFQHQDHDQHDRNLVDQLSDNDNNNIAGSGQHRCR